MLRAPKVLPGCGYRSKRRGLNGHGRLPVVDAHVGVLHETSPTRPDDRALEPAEDFDLVAYSERVRNTVPYRRAP